MNIKRIRRKSDGKWLGLNLGVQEKWLKSKSGAFIFLETDLRFDPWVKRLKKDRVEFDVVEGGLA